MGHRFNKIWNYVIGGLFLDLIKLKIKTDLKKLAKARREKPAIQLFLQQVNKYLFIFSVCNSFNDLLWLTTRMSTIKYNAHIGQNARVYMYGNFKQYYVK